MLPTILTGRNEAYTFTERTLELIAQEGKSMTVIHRIGASGEYDFNLTVEPGASVTVICMQLLKEPSTVIRQTSDIAENASVQWKNITLGSGFVQHMLIAKCQGAHAQSSIDWLFHARGNDQFDLQVKNIFSARDGTGEILVRGIVEHKALVVCHGMIEIGAKGGGTNTYLTQHVLMLDATAQVDAVPGLEIKTNDVKASHSATVSKISPEDLFYVGSRGISEQDARAMCIQGFLGELVQRIQDPAIQEEILIRLRDSRSSQ